MRNFANEIKIESTVHRNEKRLKLIFDYNEELIDKERSIPGRGWSASMHCWHVPNNGNVIDKINTTFNECKLKYAIDHSGTKDLKDWLDTALNKEIKGYINDFNEYLKFKRYSERTIEMFVSSVKILFRFLENKSPDELELHPG